MSEKYMSIGAPMTELPPAPSRSHTSASMRAASAMGGGTKFHDSCHNSGVNGHTVSQQFRDSAVYGFVFDKFDKFCRDRRDSHP